MIYEVLARASCAVTMRWIQGSIQEFEMWHMSHGKSLLEILRYLEHNLRKALHSTSSFRIDELDEVV